MSLLRLYKAVRAGKTGPALALLDSNPNLLASETPFGSLLHIAASEGYLEMVDELLRRGIDVNRRGGTFGGAAINLGKRPGIPY